jgi:hypothetical protein
MKFFVLSGMVGVLLLGTHHTLAKILLYHSDADGNANQLKTVLGNTGLLTINDVDIS